MLGAECWMLDAKSQYRVGGQSGKKRIHLGMLYKIQRLTYNIQLITYNSSPLIFHKQSLICQVCALHIKKEIFLFPDKDNQIGLAICTYYN